MSLPSARQNAAEWGPTSLRGRAVLVTGASGFIGAQLCTRLLAEGAVVHAVSRSVHMSTQVQWQVAQLGCADQVARVIDRAQPDVIFHLAGYVAGARGLDAVLPMLQANCVAAANVLAVSAQRGIARLVLAGTLEEPREGESSPSSPYAMAKWAASGYARLFHELYGTPVVNARIFMTYGPDQPDFHKLIPHVALSLLRGETPKLSSGRRLVDWIYVDDVVDGLLALATTAGVEGATVDLGSGVLHSVGDVVRALYALLSPSGEPPFGTMVDRPHEIERAAELAETTRRIGWAPRVGLDEGLRRTIAHYARVARGENVVNALGLLARRQIHAT